MIIGILASWMIFMLARCPELQCAPSIATTLASTSLLATLTASDGLHLLSMHQDLELAAEHAARGIDLLDREIDAPQLPFRRPPPPARSAAVDTPITMGCAIAGAAPNTAAITPAITQDLIPIAALLAPCRISVHRFDG